jgi:4-hydroxy-tetrahydrodipicolinate synthase
MSKKHNHNSFKGIIPPMITPLLDHNTLDAGGLERLIEHILGGGVHGLFILGTTGEGPSLKNCLQQELIDRVCKQVAHRVPVLVGITNTIFAESVAIAHKAEEAGAEAVVLAAPYYFPTGQIEFLEYLEHLINRINLPLYLYNMPGLTKFTFEPETIAVAANMDGVYGIKDSSGDMIYFHKIKRMLQDKKNFSVFIGREELLAESLLFGGDGGVTGGAIFHPKLYVDLYNAAKAKDLTKVKKLHDKVMQISAAIYGVGRYGGSSYLKGVKCALSCLGICDDFMAEPFHKFKQPERKIIQSRLKELGILEK